MTVIVAGIYLYGRNKNDLKELSRIHTLMMRCFAKG